MIVFLLFVIILLLVLVLYWLWLYRTANKAFHSRQKEGYFTTRLPEFEHNHDLILMTKPGFTMSDVVEYIKRNYPQLQQQPKIVPYCLSCDNMLFSVEGFTFSVLAQTVESPRDNTIKPPVKPNGDELPFLYTPNYKIKLPNKGGNFAERQPSTPLYPAGAEAGETVLVAVLDTGLDNYVAAEYQPAPASHCRGTLGLYGYNVITDSSDTVDDFTGSGPQIVGHGTPVTGMVLRYANRYPINVKILPVKVLNHNGYGTLLQLMCGLAYAKNAGARIINTSLGFYAADPEYVDFFKEFLDRLTADNTLIIASAGNEEVEEDELAAKEIGVASLRNLDRHLFYPAAFSGFNENIITATTVFGNRNGTNPSLQVSPRQNYSTSKVQIGVEADVAVQMPPGTQPSGQAVTDYVFLNPYGPEPSGEAWRMWSGSSFAAPVLTGLVAATYYQYLGEKEGKYSRTDYLNWLTKNGYLIRKAELLVTENVETDKVPALLLMKPEELYHVALSGNETLVAGATA